MLGETVKASCAGLSGAVFSRHDVIGKAPVGVLDQDLRRAALRALSIPRALCREFAMRFSWRRSAEQFADNLIPIRLPRRRAFG